jgi:predicted NACHT family NTPase/WD40 repeat protein
VAAIELSMVIGAIVEMGVESIWEGAKRREAVIRALRKAGLKPDAPPSDFDGVYAYTLVGYGLGKPKPILDFFRHEFIRNAFRQSFEQQDPSILNEEAESLIKWHQVGDDLRRMDVDPRREFAGFTAVFNEIVDRTRTPAEVRRDQKLDNIYGDLHQKTGEIIKRLEGLDTLVEIRAELVRLAQSYQARQFVVAPTGKKLKVFISSTMLELRDVREFVATALNDRGIEAWVYEAHAGARPDSVLGTSLREVDATDIYLGLFWRKYGEIAVEEYLHARALGKPCFVYIRDKDIQREEALEDFLEEEIHDLQGGVTYAYFDSAVKLGEQVADDVMAWLVRRHREMTAEIRAARVSQDEINRLLVEVVRLQAASRERLPHGTPADYLAQQMRAWFETLSYQFESHDIRSEDSFEWIINVPARRAYDRILVRGVGGEADMSDIAALRQAVDKQRTDEGWLVAARRISQAARDEAEKKENRDLFCYTFDELLDQDADFDRYLDWLEAEIKRQGIDRMYVPLACTKEEYDAITKQKIGASRYDKRNGWIDGYISRWLDDPSKEHISILGEFGTGKTWFALHYAWTALRHYRDAKKRGVERPRLPLVIPLRDYAKAVSVESLFSEFFFRKHEIPLPGYSAFEQLNRMGKLLLIFDGFDEMAAKVDRQKMINNFWELARVVVPGAKAIITCRTEHFPEAREGRALLSAELRASSAKLTGQPPQFEVLELEKFKDDQIRQALSLRARPATVEYVMGNPQLLDLARRPVMTEFILEALPDIEAGKPVDLSRVYLYAVRRKMERDIKAERTFTSLADKLYFLCELSWEMLSTERMSLNYRQFPARLRRLFGPIVEEQKDLDHWHYDMLGQTMLVRNADGDYTPAHRSLLEFFVAYKITAEFGVLASDFTELAQAQSYLDKNASPQDYTWSSYFRREVDETGKSISISPLNRFSPELLEHLRDTVGHAPLTKAILNLIVPMLNIADASTGSSLLEVVEATRGKTEAEVGYAGGNAATLLTRIDSTGLKNRDLTCAVIVGADLTDASLHNSVMSKANLRGTHFEYADLTSCNLRSSNLQQAQFRGTTLTGADLRDADLTNALFSEMGEVNSVAFNPDGKMLASGGMDTNVHIWDVTTGAELFTLRGHGAEVNDVCWSPNGLWIVSAGADGTSLLWDIGARQVKAKISSGEDAVYSVSFSRDGALLATTGSSGDVQIWDLVPEEPNKIVQFESGNVRSCAGIFRSIDNSCICSGLGGVIKVWDIANRELIAERRYDLPVYSLCLSPDEKKLAVGAYDYGLSLFDSKQLGDVWNILYKHDVVYQPRFSSDGRLLFAGSRHNGIIAVAVETGSKLASFPVSAWCLGLSVAPDSTLLASGSQDATIRFWDIRLYVSCDGEPHINILGYTPPNLSAITDDPTTWPEWWQGCKINVPEGMMPNPDFGKCLRTITQKLKCQELRLAGAKGLDAKGFLIKSQRQGIDYQREGTLGEWLAERGAVLD